MQIRFEIPDELARAITGLGEDPERAALEALGLEAYRQRRISGSQLRTLLGIASRYELDGFLKLHHIYDYTIEDFENDFASIREFRERRDAARPA